MGGTTEKYRRVADGYTERVEGCREEQWSLPTPCEGWSVADLVRHVTDTHADVLASIGVTVDRDDDLLSSWVAVRDRFVVAMDDPATAGLEVVGPLGPLAFKQLAGGILLHDVLVHTWDLAFATDQPLDLDPDAVHVAFERMSPVGDFIRGPSMFGPAIEAPTDADEQTRFLCFVGRDAASR